MKAGGLEGFKLTVMVRWEISRSGWLADTTPKGPSVLVCLCMLIWTRLTVVGTLNRPGW